MKNAFRKFAELVAYWAATPWAFLLAVLVVLIWAASGPPLKYSGRWELTINSITTIITFLMVFIIQNTQNRDFKVLQIQVGELVRALRYAHRGLIDIQELSDDDLLRLEQALRRVRGHDSVDEMIRSMENGVR